LRTGLGDGSPLLADDTALGIQTINGLQEDDGKVHRNSPFVITVVLRL
jgi:hypothetical protein